jgi:hypothetical protein
MGRPELVDGSPVDLWTETVSPWGHTENSTIGASGGGATTPRSANPTSVDFSRITAIIHQIHRMVNTLVDQL